MTGHLLFAYGTLQVPEVMTRVTHRQFRNVPAMLPHYQRYLVKGKVYPAILSAAHKQVQGRLFFNVDPISLAKLDRYEGSCYVRRQVLAKSEYGALYLVQTYIYRKQYRHHLDTRDWDMASYLRQYARLSARQRNAFVHQ